MAAKPVIIVESPAKIRTIKHFVGDSYRLESSMGHVRDLPVKEFGVSVDDGFTPHYVIIPKKKAVIAKLRKAVAGAPTVYLASDPDREGEAIAWHLAEALKIKDPERIEFNEITRSAVTAALRRPRKIDMHRVNAQQARRVLDRLVGYKLSPLLQAKLNRRGLSAGRVQSVAVRLICDREREIRAFEPAEYWEIDAQFSPLDSETPFAAKLVGIGDEKVQIDNETRATEAAADARGQSYAVRSLTRTEQRRSPPRPLITSTLQQEASNRLSYRPRRTMLVAQQLYEGMEIGEEGAVGLITYMRTDSTRVAAEAQHEAREFVREHYGEQALPERPPTHKARPGAQEAHEAIRPTSVARTPDKMTPYLTPEQARLYQLIWTRFVASQMAPAVLDLCIVDIAGGPYAFEARELKVKSPGFSVVYPLRDRETALPALHEGEPLRLLELTPSQHFTEPPARYSEASLVRALEANGIGRPSTYAPIIETILNRGYVYLDNRRFRPTDLGFVVTDQLVAHFPDLINVEFTAAMEGKLDEVEEGTANWEEVVGGFYGPFEEQLGAATEKMEKITIPAQPTDEICEQCGSPMLLRTSRFGPFLACSNFPTCKNKKRLVVDAEDGETLKERPAPEPTGEVCEKCGKPMVVRRSRRGPFLGCSGYPECRNTRPLEGTEESAASTTAPRRAEPEAVGRSCPECGKPLVTRRSRRGPFVGCSGYPSCRHTESLPTAKDAEAE